MVTPQIVYISTFSASGGAGQSNTANLAFSFTNSGFEAFIPVKVLNPATNNLSGGCIVYAQRSTDGGATYESIPDAPLGLIFALPTNAQTQTKDLILRDPGVYQITVVTGFGCAATWSVAFGATIMQVSAYA